MTGLGLAIAASAAFGGFLALPASQPSGSRAMSVVAATGPTSVPIWSPDWGSSYSTKVTLGGLNVDMTIDTGANSMAVTRDLAEKLLSSKAAVASEPNRVTMANGQADNENTIVIGTVKIGDRVLHDVPSFVVPNNGMTLLPLPVLAHMGSFTLDTTNLKLTFGQPSAPAAPKPMLASSALHDQLATEIGKVAFPQKVNDVMTVTGVRLDGLHLTFLYDLKSASQFNDRLKDIWTKNACAGDARQLMAQGASYRYEYWTDGAFVGGFDVVCS
jgi:clan AA aspartic protease (TIGR02281 family)